MRRDSLFYRLFQQFPDLLFDLVESPPPDASDYRFDSVAVKEPKFEIDGVFLPPKGSSPGIVYFCEVQFQKDEQLYERLFGESFLYFYRQRHLFSDWQAVVIYPSRSIEQSSSHPYRSLLNSDQVHRIYLNELGEPRQLPLGIGLMVLTTVTEAQAPEQARTLLSRAQQEVAEPDNQQAIIDIVTTIMVYRFTKMSRQEVEAMLGLQLQDTRFYQEVKEEGRQEGRQEGIAHERALVVRLLNRKVGSLPEVLVLQVQQLSLRQLEDLGETLLDFDRLANLEDWLSQLRSQSTTTLQRLIEQLGELEESISLQVKALPLSQLALLADISENLTGVNEVVDWLQSHAADEFEPY
ncbi:MAG: Rpn family recombination-promoting nuclease/putative transposase [Cyanobacteria bacterium P01_D01_bin.44]